MYFYPFQYFLINIKDHFERENKRYNKYKEKLIELARLLNKVNFEILLEFFYLFKTIIILIDFLININRLRWTFK